MSEDKKKARPGTKGTDTPEQAIACPRCGSFTFDITGVSAYGCTWHSDTNEVTDSDMLILPEWPDHVCEVICLRCNRTCNDLFVEDKEHDAGRYIIVPPR